MLQPVLLPKHFSESYRILVNDIYLFHKVCLDTYSLLCIFRSLTKHVGGVSIVYSNALWIS